MTVTFLRAVIAQGVRVVATSNSLPDRLGEGRFAADDFTREIAAIAAHFEVVRIDGPDYRAKARVEADPFSAERDRQGGANARRPEAPPRADDELRRRWSPTCESCRPVQVAAALEGLDAVVDPRARTARQPGRGPAVRAPDRRDLRLGPHVRRVGMRGRPTSSLPSYRRGGYRKKYGRCESRLAALLGEARVAAGS